MDRFTYYGLGGTPYLYVNGVNRGYSSSAWDGYITSAAAGDAPVSIEFSGNYDYITATGTCNLSVTAETGVTGDYKLHLVLVEDEEEDM